MDTENRIVKIDELEVGDEFLIPFSQEFRYYKLLKKPIKNPKTGNWMGLRVSWKRVERQYSWGGGSHTYYAHECSSDEHNIQSSLRYIWKPIWLVRRNNN